MSVASAIVIVGPTGVGKTQLALRVADRIGGEIVSVDSRQIYRGLDIGTAKPTACERAAIRHHLLDLADPGEAFSAGRFAAAASQVLDDLAARRRVPLLVGGSGLYLAAIVDGLFSTQAEGAHLAARRRELEGRLAREGLAALWAELGRLDPAAQRSLSPGDKVRILRALELARGGPHRSARWSRCRQEGLLDAPLMFALHRERQDLYARIDIRAGTMWERGWVEEVVSLLRAGHQGDDPGLVSLGYREVVAHLVDGVPAAVSLEAIRRRTRQYAKRQLTWFRRDRRLRWLDLGWLDDAAAADRIVRRWQAVDTVRRRAPPPSRALSSSLRTTVATHSAR